MKAITRALPVFMAAALPLGIMAAPGSAAPASAHNGPLSVHPASAPVNLRLRARPGLVDIGSDVTFILTASSWPGPSTASLTFVSPHHGFQGPMTWQPQCGCFEVAVHLAPHIHPIEQARVTATVKYGRSSFVARAAFSIRGLAPGGRTLAPGGKPRLRVWVSDPTPLPQETEHFCAWVYTADGLGVSGVKVRFQVHYPDGTRSWNAGSTPASGLLCSQRTIGNVQPGRTVRVDTIAGSLRSSTSFTPRSG